MNISRNFISNRVGLMALLGALATVLLGGCSEQTQPGHETTNVDASTAVEVADQRREIVLSVPGMDCPMCPVTVRRALSGVDGVFETEADLETKRALVTFDPQRTDIDRLIGAVERAGFSATLEDGGDE